jgi:hypothetical protein
MQFSENENQARITYVKVAPVGGGKVAFLKFIDDANEWERKIAELGRRVGGSGGGTGGSNAASAARARFAAAQAVQGRGPVGAAQGGAGRGGAVQGGAGRGGAAQGGAGGGPSVLERCSLLRTVIDLVRPIGLEHLGKALAKTASLVNAMMGHVDDAMRLEVRSIAPRAGIGGFDPNLVPVSLLGPILDWMEPLAEQRMRDVEAALDDGDDVALCFNPWLWWIKKMLDEFGEAAISPDPLHKFAAHSRNRLKALDDIARTAGACDEACVDLLKCIVAAERDVLRSERNPAAADAAATATAAIQDAIAAGDEVLVRATAARGANQDSTATEMCLNRAIAHLMAAKRAALQATPRGRLIGLLSLFEEASKIGGAALTTERIFLYVRSCVDNPKDSRSPLVGDDAWAVGEWSPPRVEALKALVRSRGPLGTVGRYRGQRVLGEVGQRWRRVAERCALGLP